MPPYTCDTVSVSELHVTLCPSKQYAPCPTLGDTQKSPQPTTLRSGSGRQPPPGAWRMLLTASFTALLTLVY